MFQNMLCIAYSLLAIAFERNAMPGQYTIHVYFPGTDDYPPSALYIQ